MMTDTNNSQAEHNTITINYGEKTIRGFSSVTIIQRDSALNVQEGEGEYTLEDYLQNIYSLRSGHEKYDDAIKQIQDAVLQSNLSIVKEQLESIKIDTNADNIDYLYPERKDPVKKYEEKKESKDTAEKAFDSARIKAFELKKALKKATRFNPFHRKTEEEKQKIKEMKDTLDTMPSILSNLQKEYLEARRECNQAERGLKNMRVNQNIGAINLPLYSQPSKIEKLASAIKKSNATPKPPAPSQTSMLTSWFQKKKTRKNSGQKPSPTQEANRRNIPKQ